MENGTLIGGRTIRLVGDGWELVRQRQEHIARKARSRERRQQGLPRVVDNVVSAKGFEALPNVMLLPTR